jgi:uncharacterized SAM-binding protein YcdF (DUF218 family)
MITHFPTKPSFLVYPLVATIVIAAAVLALSFTSRRRMGLVLLSCTLATLWVASTPSFGNWLNLRLESRFPPVSVETLPQSDVVILLGGGPDRRIMHALQVYRAGKAPRILVSGDKPPWHAAAVLGVPRSVFIVETESQNTRENAINSAALFKEHGWRNGLLVTSAAHMPRALAAFQRVGLNITPVATDTYTDPFRSSNLRDLLPDRGALNWTMLAIKEMFALCVYSYRGWA